MVFCNILDTDEYLNGNEVTILILIDGFLQYKGNWIGAGRVTSQSLF